MADDFVALHARHGGIRLEKADEGELEDAPKEKAHEELVVPVIERGASPHRRESDGQLACALEGEWTTHLKPTQLLTHGQ